MEVLSRETIKPSSSTPHLQKLNLSFLDQLQPPAHVSIILYYEAQNPFGPESISQNLRSSLSDALAKYYPLAGRINFQEHSTVVDCNDAGVAYTETRVHTQLSEVTKNPDIHMEELQKYAPMMEPVAAISSSNVIAIVPLGIQVNFFDCGGIAIGLSTFHQLCDLASLAAFINSWAALCRGEPGSTILQPSFDISGRFPPINLSRIRALMPPLPPDDKTIADKNPLIMKKFVFQKEKLTTLIKQAEPACPTKVEAVTAFLWLHFMRAHDHLDCAKETIFTVSHVVDLRSRASPPLPQHFFGNACARAVALFSSKDQEQATSLDALAMALRSAIRTIDHKYIEKMQNGEEYLDMSSYKLNNPSVEGFSSVESCRFTSWCRFPMYEVDYGWGRPIWVSPVGGEVKNLVALVDTPDGDGIEAWLIMTEEVMAAIGKQYNLLCP